MFLGSSQAANVSDLYTVALQLATDPKKLQDIRNELADAIKQKAEADAYFARRTQETEALGSGLASKEAALDAREQEISLHENNYQDLITRLNEREAVVVSKETGLAEQTAAFLNDFRTREDALNKAKSDFAEYASGVESDLAQRINELTARQVALETRENNVAVAKADLDKRIEEASRFLKV